MSKLLAQVQPGWHALTGAFVATIVETKCISSQIPQVGAELHELEFPIGLCYVLLATRDCVASPGWARLAQEGHMCNVHTRANQSCNAVLT